MRFTIRDMLWLTVVVGTAVTWSIDRNQLRTKWRSEREEMLAKWEQDHREIGSLIKRLGRSYKASDEQRRELADEIVSRLNSPVP
jgi:hypothetical protein